MSLGRTVGNARRQIEVAEVARLHRQLFRRIGNSHGSPTAVRPISVAGRVHGRWSGGGIEHGSGTRLARGCVVTDAGIDSRSARKLKNETLVVPAAVALVVLQKLVVADVSAGKDLEIHAKLVGV